METHVEYKERIVELEAVLKELADSGRVGIAECLNTIERLADALEATLRFVPWWQHAWRRKAREEINFANKVTEIGRRSLGQKAP